MRAARWTLIFLSLVLLAGACGGDDEFADDFSDADLLADELCTPDLLGDEDGPVTSM